MTGLLSNLPFCSNTLEISSEHKKSSSLVKLPIEIGEAEVKYKWPKIIHIYEAII